MPLMWGEAWHELPARCRLAPPERPGAWFSWPMTYYGGLVCGLLARGVPVPGHPSACAVPGCGHARVWHRHCTKTHPCQAGECSCLEFTSQQAEPVVIALTEVTGPLTFGPGRCLRLDFFGGDMQLLGSRDVPAEGGTVAGWPGSSFWRAVRVVAR